MLEASALYREQSGETAVLDGVDPDIGETVRAVLGIAEPNRDLDAGKTKTSPIGFARADHLVTKQERIEIASRLVDVNGEWPTPASLFRSMDITR